MKTEEFTERLSGNLWEELSSKFDFIAELPPGGYAGVYKVKDKNLKRLCALKIFDKSKLPGVDDNEKENVEAKFIQEAEILAKLQHPNIVQVYNVDAVDNTPYIVMQHIDGKNLAGYLNEKGKLSFTEVLEKSGPILSALHYIHSEGLVHKDLKPENIMIKDGSGEIVIIDFGIAKDLCDSSSSPSTIPIIGSCYYMAPEQWTKKNVDARVDIYSYGVILYQMLTGETPFKGGLVQVMRGHLEGIVPNVKEKNPDAPIGIQKVIRKAMAKEPGDRYTDALELLDAIKKAEKEDDGYPPLEIQKKLEDRYTFDGELLGQGQFSKVYSMHHRIKKGEYALKIMDFDFTLQNIEKSGFKDEYITKELERRKNRFKEKANFFDALQYHPNIVKIDNSGFMAVEYESIKFEIPYLVLKRIRGLKLIELIEKESPLALIRILNIADNILSALFEIHKNDYVYWEVIPEKIFVEAKTDNAILLSAGLPDNKDIGSASFVSETKVIIDRRFWDARDYLPLRTNPKRRGIASDISLFGILLYQMLTGKKYYDRNLFEMLNEETDEQIFHEIKKNPSLPEDIAKRFVSIIKRTMLKDLRRRYKNVKRIRVDLEKVKEDYLKRFKRK